MFAPRMGIVEDPATGSAAAAFAGLLGRFGGYGDGEHSCRDRAGLRNGPAEPDPPRHDHRRGGPVDGGDGRRRAPSIVAEGTIESLTQRAAVASIAAMTGPAILHVERLDLAFAPEPWPFAEQRRAEIDAYFAELRREKPAIWNGRVLVLRRHERRTACSAAAISKPTMRASSAWRHWGRPDAGVHDCFGAAAVISADGAVLLGVMGAHTVNAGRIYFPCGTPDPSDIVERQGRSRLQRRARAEGGDRARHRRSRRRSRAGRRWSIGQLIAHIKMLRSRRRAEHSARAHARASGAARRSRSSPTSASCAARPISIRRCRASSRRFCGITSDR